MSKSKSLRTLLVPQYMNQFKCIGSACEDTCCVGWRVTIDKKTYQKYRKVKTKNLKLKNNLTKQVTRNRANPSETNYAKIKMNKVGACPFLNNDQLCSIQSELGEDYLSNTCKVYPRIFSQVDQVVEKSGSMSCPEVARLALLNPNKMEFDEQLESTKTIGIIGKSISTNKIHSLTQLFWNLRVFSIQVLQHREYSMEERFILLGMFYHRIRNLVDNGNLSAIHESIETYRIQLQEESLKKSIAKIPAKLDFQMKLCKALVDHRISAKVSGSRYMDCVEETLQGLHFSEEIPVDKVINHYQHAYERYYLPYMREHEYLLENYFVNYVFQKLFPYDEKNFFDSYSILVVHFALIKLHLIGMSSYHQGLSEEIVVKLIQSFSKNIDHHKQFLMNVMKLLKENKLNQMTYMAILIKN